DCRIELDALEPHFDEIGLRNRAFLKTCQVELHELLKGLTIFCRDIDAAPGKNGFEVEVFDFRNAFAHLVCETSFARRRCRVGHPYSGGTLASKFECFRVRGSDFIQAAGNEWA